MPPDAGSRFPLLAPALLVGLALGWGVNWPIMKIGLAEIPPWTYRGWTTLIAGITLLGIVRISGKVPVPAPDEWRGLALASLFNVTGWNIFVAYGVMLVASGHAALLAYTMPLWTVLISWLFLRERISGRAWLALALGLAGIVTLLQRSFTAIDAAPLGGLLCLLAAVSWSIGTLIMKRRTTNVPVLALTGWQLILGALPMLALLPVVEGIQFPQASREAWLAAASTTFISLAFCYVVWFQMVRLLPATVASISVLLVPMVGTVAGALLLDEPFGARELLAMGFIGCALVLVLYAPSARPQPTTAD
jgi:drug/metabolite transporter (DMT)-like permease